MKLRVLATLLVVSSAPAVAQDRSADEKAIRDLVAKSDAGRGNEVLWTDDVVLGLEHG